MTNLIKTYLLDLTTRYHRNISVYSDSFLQNSINYRKRSLEIENEEEYFNYLMVNEAEADLLIDKLTNSYSEFFRNPLTFAYLEKIILPQLIERKKARNEKEIRIWSCACASGQEVYSLAILADELMKSYCADITFRIFATDISAKELLNAKNGVYNQVTLENVTLKRIQTYFTKEGEAYIVDARLKEYIDFSEFDLLSNQECCPPASVYGNFDLVFCSNLLFYYKSEYQEFILNKAGNCLAQGGYLVTSETERDIVKEKYYREVFNNSAIFQKREIAISPGPLQTENV